jgi:hypothetical protein
VRPASEAGLLELAYTLDLAITPKIPLYFLAGRITMAAIREE